MYAGLGVWDHPGGDARDGHGFGGAGDSAPSFSGREGAYSICRTRLARPCRCSRTFEVTNKPRDGRKGPIFRRLSR